MDGHIIIGTELDTKEFDSQITYIERQMEEIEDKLKKADMGFEVGDTVKLEAQYEKLSNKLSELIKKKQDLSKTDFSKMQQEIAQVGNGVTNVISKMGKWALAVFGIRSAYSLVRTAMSTLSQYNDQMATNVEYIRYLLASTLQPIIETLIQLAYKLLTYINFIAKAWFGVDLFANASADAFNRNKKALGGATKSAKELKKTLAGFDEMNILQENGSTSTGGGGGGVSLPTLPSFEDVEIPGWVQWIADNGELIKNIILGIGTAIAALKLANLFKTLGLFADLPLWQLVGGLALIITGVGLAIKGVIDFINDPSWHNFLTILEGIALVVAGIAVLMGGWVVALIALGVAIVAAVIQNWDKVKGILGAVGGWIYDHIIKPVLGFFKGLWDGIVGGFNTAVSFVKSIFDGLIKFFKGIISTIIGLFLIIGTAVGDVIGGAFKGVINGVLGAIENILNFPIRSINKLIDVINAVPGIDLKPLQTFKLPRLAKGGILNMPGRGVDYYGANIAEKGQEAVLPLTDSQQMDLLGASIARHMVVNLTNINQMNGRVISRELQRVQNNDDFAFNR